MTSLIDDLFGLHDCEWPHGTPQAPNRSRSITLKFGTLRIRRFGDRLVSALAGVQVSHPLLDFSWAASALSGNSFWTESIGSPPRIGFTFWRIGIEKKLPGAVFVRGWCEVPCAL